MIDCHSQIRLSIESEYVGRLCPIRRVPLQLHEDVVVCDNKKEVVSLDGWGQLDECPYCGDLTRLQPVSLPNTRNKVSEYGDRRPGVQVPKSVLAILIIGFIILGVGVILLVFREDPSISLPTSSLSQSNASVDSAVDIALSPILPTKTSTPGTVITAIPMLPFPTPTSQIATRPDPLDTITEYVALLNSGQYERAFAILSDGFKGRNHCCDADGNYSIQPYIDYWQTVDRLVLVDLFLESQSDSQAVVNTVWRFERVNTDDVVLRYRITLNYKNQWEIERVVFVENES